MTRFTISALLILSLFGISSCKHMEAERARTAEEWNEVSHPLNPGAESVELFEYVPQAEREFMSDVGIVKCKKCLNQKTLKANQIDCKNELRNQAKAMNGDVVIINEGWDSINGEPLSNCVDVKGTVYKKKTASAQ